MPLVCVLTGLSPASALRPLLSGLLSAPNGDEHARRDTRWKIAYAYLSFANNL